MPTYLLTWNPDRFHWDQYDEDAIAVGAGKSLTSRWSCGNSTSIPAGARFFMIRQGRPPRGVIAAGWVTDGSFKQEHWDPERAKRGDKTNYVGVRLEELLTEDADPLPVERFSSGPLSQVNWSTPASGIRIRDDAAVLLEAEWARFRGSSREYSEEEFIESVELQEELVLSGSLEERREVAIRTEQGFLRQHLFRGKMEEECLICGRSFPTDLLRAAHIKRRADCTIEEKRDYRNNVIPMCTFGCDELFERGYIAVVNGRVRKGSRASTTPSVLDYIGAIEDRPSPHYYRGGRTYFEWHAHANGHVP